VAEGGGCLRAFVIAMTDGYYIGADSTVSPSVGNTDSDGVDRMNQTSVFDRGVFTGPNSGSSPTLADIAMYYYENDLHRGLSDVVPAHNQDTARHQHMVTYGVAFGVTGELDPAAFPNCLPRCAPTDSACPDAVCPSWTAPTTQPRKIDDLYHAAVNGRGLFLSADSPETLVGSLLRVMQDIQAHKATGASVSINTQELRSDTYLYQATYIPGEWIGDVEAKPLDPTYGYIQQVQDALGNYVDQVDWSASAKLQTKGWANRQIVTYNDASLSGVPFEYASLSAPQKALLNGNATIAQALTNYLRGDASEEIRNGGLFRDRSRILGDIVHASPMPYRWDSSLPGVIFAGANDGMLHALRESDGVEVFAYVPNLVLKNLKLLSEDPYVHKYFVDSEPFIKKLGSGPTLLVGGLGRGGRGYYCLDISSMDAKTGAAGTTPPFNQSIDASSVVKWEYPVNSDPENAALDPDMGYSYSQAYIVNSNAGWVVIFGNGYNSANGDAALYVLRLTSTGDLVSATPTKIRTYSGGAAPNCNGLSSPALVDVNLDGKVDFAYAGDLLGNLWKFDLRASSVSSWKVAYNTQAAGTGAPRPLFQAKNQAGFRQPITTQPDIMRHCRFDRYGYLVIFGTGRYLGLDDYNDAGSTQSIYGIWDWAEAWEKLNPALYSADKRNSTAKFLGAFDANRQLTNLLNNPLIPETDQIIYSIDVSQSGLGDAVTIDGVTFTRAALTTASTRSFNGASGLALCINNATYGVSGVRASSAGTNVVVRTDPPGDTLNVSTANATGTITAQAIDLKVTLLNQNLVFSNSEILVLSDNPIDWFDTAFGTGMHVGWYYDLPGNSERVVNDVIIQDGKVIVVPTIPSDSPCSTGGDSIIFAMDACTGGRTSAAFFDINGDLRVDGGDLINIGTASNPIWVAPTGLRRKGLWYTPAVLNIPGSAWDRLFFSTSNAGTEDEIIAGEQLGIYYWRNW
jgi:Tfp pilus tip-associated adhesin PilY1